VNKENLTTETSKIDWAIVENLPLADIPDEDSPELTASEFLQLQPIAKLVPELSFATPRTVIMLDNAIVQAYKIKAGSQDYQALINETLRRALELESLKETLREVIREELHLA
jgi:hypothetical protein